MSGLAQFYDMIQKALAAPNAITIDEYWSSLASFITLAGMYIALYVAISFFTAHFLFRWRTAMVEWYHSVYDKARKIEGASHKEYKKIQLSLHVLWNRLVQVLLSRLWF